MKEDRQISLTACLYRREPLAHHKRTKHSALSTKRVSALGAAATERETRDTEEEDHPF